MPSEDTYFKGRGKGITSTTKPICAKFPPAIDAILRDVSKVGDRSDYIRRAVEKQLREDGMISKYKEES